VPAGKGRPIPGYSYDHSGKRVADARIKTWLRRLVLGPDSAFGYRKLTILLRRKYQLVINKKKVYRLCKELQLLAPQRERTNAVPRKVANNRVVTGPNQLWQMDIKYGYVAGQRRHFYVASIIDVFDRNIVAYHRGHTCRTPELLQTVEKALKRRGVQTQGSILVLRTDNGPQFVSKAFHEYCECACVEHERIPPRTPNKNAFIESFHSILERECYQQHCFESKEEAFAEVDRFIRYYNNHRIHGSLNDWSPREYLAKVLEGTLIPKKIAL
jgi:putative transposase